MRATLYRCSNPTDWLCPCGRIERELVRRRIEHDTVRTGLKRGQRPQVEALSGQQRVPLLVLDGDVICDSHRIVEHLRWRDEQPPPAERPPARTPLF